ncbi:MAG: hypothetical protein AB7O59_01480 [Pirellulales bacterium]
MLAELLLLVVSATPAQAPAAAAERVATPAPTAANESLEVRYCRAQLQLAEANLERLLRMNRKLARSVPDSIVVERRHDVETARLRLEQALDGDRGDAFSAWISRAHDDFAAADTRWKKAVAVNGRSPGTIDPLDVERYRLRAEVFRLQHEQGQALAAAPPDQQLAWRVELLTNELEILREEAQRIVPAARFYYYAFPHWW